VGGEDEESSDEDAEASAPPEAHAQQLFAHSTAGGECHGAVLIRNPEAVNKLLSTFRYQGCVARVQEELRTMQAVAGSCTQLQAVALSCRQLQALARARFPRA
jgi:hypothetical protein